MTVPVGRKRIHVGPTGIPVGPTRICVGPRCWTFDLLWILDFPVGLGYFVLCPSHRGLLCRWTLGFKLLVVLVIFPVGPTRTPVGPTRKPVDLRCWTLDFFFDSCWRQCFLKASVVVEFSLALQKTSFQKAYDD